MIISFQIQLGTVNFSPQIFQSYQSNSNVSSMKIFNFSWQDGTCGFWVKKTMQQQLLRWRQSRRWPRQWKTYWLVISFVSSNHPVHNFPSSHFQALLLHALWTPLLKPVKCTKTFILRRKILILSSALGAPYPGDPLLVYSDQFVRFFLITA